MPFRNEIEEKCSSYDLEISEGINDDLKNLHSADMRKHFTLFRMRTANFKSLDKAILESLKKSNYAVKINLDSVCNKNLLIVS